MSYKNIAKQGGLKNPPFYIEAILIFVVIAVLIGWFFKAVLSSNNIFVERDLNRYYYPLRFFAVNCIKSGTFPLWNPYIFCGNPLFATLQSSILYPLSIIYYLGDFTKAFNIFVLVHFFLAAVFTYIFLRQMRYSMVASFLSAAAFCFSGYLTSVINLLTTLSVVAWFPLAILFYYKMIKAAKCQQPSRVACSQERPETATVGFGARILSSLVPKLRFGTPWPLRQNTSCSQPTLAVVYTNAIILGVIFTVMFLGGEPSVLYATIGLFLLGSIYFTVEALIENKKGPDPFLYIKGMLIAIVVFFSLSAFQLLPFWEFLKTSSREKASYQMASIWNLPLADTPGIILPFFHDVFKMFADYWSRQAWLDNYYIGILVFLFFLIGVLFDKSKKAKAILILGLVGFGISLGKDTVIFEFLYKLAPGFKVMRYSIRFFFIPTFAMCVLAGMGLDYYARFIKIDARLKKAAFAILTLAFLSSIVFWLLNFNFQGCLDFAIRQAAKFPWRSNLPRLYVEEIVKGPLFLKFVDIDLVNLTRASLLLVFFGMLFYLGAKDRVRTNIFVVPWLAFLAIADIVQVNNGFYPLFDAKKFTAPTTNVEYLMKEYKSESDAYPDDFNKQLFRICCSPQIAREHAYVPERDFYKGLEASKDRLITNRMTEFGIYDVNMYGSIYIRRNSRFMNLVMERRSKNLEKLLMLLNVRFVASLKQPNAVGFKLVNKAEAANLYETNKYSPRAFLAEKAVVIKDEEKIIEKLREGDFQPAKEVILEEYVSIPQNTPRTQPALAREAAGRPGNPEPRTETVRIKSYAPNKVIIEAMVLGKPKFLVLTDTHYPGWKAFVDGKEEKILRADYIFRAVYLEPGRHKIEFIYSPFSFKLGVFITLLTIGIILTIIISYNIIIWINRKRKGR